MSDVTSVLRLVTGAPAQPRMGAGGQGAKPGPGLRPLPPGGGGAGGNFRVALSGPRTQQHKCGLSVPDSTQCWARLPGGPAVFGIRRVAVVPRAGNGELGTQEARASRTAGEGRGHRLSVSHLRLSGATFNLRAASGDSAES
uniref:Uncharacterized protein n=1 Tax=Rousettus aegyptiacus TaxID=9407 RepID=A0A7J8H058_ROUAE|nr:hypothetical protein HJG63_011138 [Rousettus aegyptiacus]